jgi:hypothetical protein
MATLKAIVAERLRLETEYPLAPNDEATWYGDLVGSIRAIMASHGERVFQETLQDWYRFLGSPTVKLFDARRDIDALRDARLREAEIMKGEREYQKRVVPVPSTRSPIILNISHSNIAGLNVDGVVGSIQATVNTLQTGGEEKIAEALKALAEAIAAEATLSAETKRESLELLSGIGDELARPGDQRRPGVLRTIGASLKVLVSNPDKVYAAYEMLKVAVKATTGIELP